ncbi:MAG TPA: DUF87 domain-containing protein [Thermoanaerobaculia bacterium]|nr:DUF87 domain-containing protein [Thermoanaerobaculia bacterium]
MKLHIAGELTLPPDAVTQTFGVLAVRGAGKSNLAAVMAEEMYAAHLPFVAIDPVGSWWGLRSSGDGSDKGLSIPIFGGRHGDVPLERTAGHLIADLVIADRLSCVIDVSEFSEGEKTHFLTDFAEQLYRRNQEPLHLFLEEADDYAPQRPMREQARLLRAWENIVRRGRARGLGITMITQRSAALNKNVLTQIETLFVLRTTSPQDRRAIAAWVEYHGQAEELLESLPSLESGEAWVWSPSWLNVMKRIRVRRRATFDSGATPKQMKGARRPATLVDVDLGAVREKMAATIERAKESDPRELKKRIAELERELKKKPAAAPVPADASRVRAEVKREIRAEWEPLLKERDTAIRDLQAKQVRIGRLLEKAQSLHEEIARELGKELPKLSAVPATESVPAVPRREMPTASTRKATTPRPPRPSGEASDLTGPEQRILDAIAWMESIGVAEPEQTAVAFLAGYTIGGGAFNNPRGALRTKGLIDYRGQRIVLTDAGRALANWPDQTLTTDELQRRVLERLPGPEQKILRVLFEVYPDSIENDELARRAGYEPGGGAFNNPRGRLRSLGLIEYPERGRVVARSILFLEDR